MDAIATAELFKLKIYFNFQNFSMQHWYREIVFHEHNKSIASTMNSCLLIQKRLARAYCLPWPCQQRFRWQVVQNSVLRSFASFSRPALETTLNLCTSRTWEYLVDISLWKWCCGSKLNIQHVSFENSSCRILLFYRNEGVEDRNNSESIISRGDPFFTPGQVILHFFHSHSISRHDRVQSQCA